MADEDRQLQNRGPTASVAQAVEGPPGLGAWLGQTQSNAGHSRLEWQESCGSREGMLCGRSLRRTFS